MPLLDKEKRTALLLSKHNLTYDETYELRELFFKYQDWSRVLGYISMHKVIGSAWININKLINISQKAPPTNLYFIKLVESMYHMQVKRAEDYIRYVSIVCDELEKNKIKYAVLKGIPISITLYEQFGMRWFNDSDILVHSEQLEFAIEILKELGYIQGNLDRSKNKIVKADRKSILASPLLSHEVHPFIKMVDGNVITHHNIDLHFSLDLLTNNRTNHMVHEFLENSIVISKESYRIRTLSWVEHLLFLCNHYYKEAIYFREVKSYKDFMLYKINDVYRLISIKRDLLCWNEVLDKACTYNLTNALYFTLVHTKEIYDHDNLISEKTLKTIESKVTPEVLHTVFDEKGSPKFCWNLSIIDRFFEMNRVEKIINHM